jgi:hypothetical protein
VQEIFIDATYSTSRSNTHFYGIIAEELGYSIPVGFMVMEIHEKEDTRTSKHAGEAKECNRIFYAMAKRLGMESHFVHTDKDFSEINAAKVCRLSPCIMQTVQGMGGHLIVSFYISLCIMNYETSSLSLCVLNEELVGDVPQGSLNSGSLVLRILVTRDPCFSELFELRIHASTKNFYSDNCGSLFP